MKTTSSITFFILLFSFVCEANASEVSSNASPVVAQMLDRKITADEIGLKFGAYKMPIIISNSDTSCTIRDPIDELCSAVIKEAMRDHIEKNDLKATREEVREYKNYQDLFMAKDRIKKRKQLEETEIHLKDTTLTPKEREQTEKRRSTLLSLARHEKQADGQGQLTDEELRDVYGPMIELWKFNKSVYEKYGGSVAITKFGPSPTEATNALLTQYEKDGKLLIYDENLKRMFWSRLAKLPSLTAKAEKVDFTPYWKKPLPNEEN